MDKSVHPILRLEQIEKNFISQKHLKQVLKRVNLQVNYGEMIGLVGESGCGKSTLIMIALKLIQLDKGKIYFDGMDITPWNFHEVRKIRKDFQAVFQSTVSSFNPRMRVRDILTESLHNFNLPINERVLINALESVMLPKNLLDRMPSQLSGGQKQRIAIARAAMIQPKLILFDEVTSNLDTLTAHKIIALIRSLNEMFGTACVFVTHDIRLAQELCKDIAVMNHGVIEEIFPSCQEPKTSYARLLIESS